MRVAAPFGDADQGGSRAVARARWLEAVLADRIGVGPSPVTQDPGAAPTPSRSGYRTQMDTPLREKGGGRGAASSIFSRPLRSRLFRCRTWRARPPLPALQYGSGCFSPRLPAADRPARTPRAPAESPGGARAPGPGRIDGRRRRSSRHAKGARCDKNEGLDPRLNARGVGRDSHLLGSA